MKFINKFVSNDFVNKLTVINLSHNLHLIKNNVSSFIISAISTNRIRSSITSGLDSIKMDNCTVALIRRVVPKHIHSHPMEGVW